MAGSTERARCNSQFHLEAVLSPAPQTNMQIPSITEGGYLYIVPLPKMVSCTSCHYRKWLAIIVSLLKMVSYTSYHYRK